LAAKKAHKKVPTHVAEDGTATVIGQRRTKAGTHSTLGENRGPHSGKGVSQDGTTNRNPTGGIGGGRGRKARTEKEKEIEDKFTSIGRLAYARAAGKTTQGAVKRPNITNVNSQESGGNTYPKKKKRTY
jgi:hypothetical protein